MKMCDCNQGRLPCTCKSTEMVSVPREVLENIQRTVCDRRYWQQLAEIMSAPVRAGTCGAEVNGGQGFAIEAKRLLSASVDPRAEPVSPMAKMAEAFRKKGESERADFHNRVQSGEWGPVPDREFCAVCDGSGWKDESFSELCPYCKGHGYKEVCAVLRAGAGSSAAVDDLRDLLLELLDEENSEIYPGAIERTGGSSFDFEDWAHRARAALERKS